MKKVLFTSFYFFFIISMSSQVTTEGLVTFFPFDGNSNDATSSNNHATVYNATLAPDRFGNANSAYSFNGTSSYLYLESAKNLDNPNYTYSVWVKTDKNPALGQGYCILEAGTENGQFGIGMSINNNYVNTTGFIVNQNGNLLYNNVLPSSNSWYLFTLTKDEDSLKLFVNNKVVKSLYLNKVPTYDAYFSLYIGKRHIYAPYTQYFKGLLDDIRIYNRALTNQEIEEIYFDFNPLGIDLSSSTLDSKLISIYPNPAVDNLFIKSENQNVVGSTFKITNSQGLIIYEGTLYSDGINISLNSFTGEGVYLVSFYDSNHNLLEAQKVTIR
jgi:Concanavalin A-like lectin/glucanases superfamily/Secretion system C-terminal sorting domain